MTRVASAASGGGGGDPHFANVITLFHFNGTNGSTSFPDQKGNAVTVEGGAAITTASGFDGSEVSFDDTAGGIYSALGTGGLLGDIWTIECFVTPAALASTRYFLNLQATDNGNYIYILINANGSISGNHRGGSIPASAAGAFAVNTRTHLAVCADGAKVRIFAGGVLASSRDLSGSDPAGSVTLRPARIFNLNFGGSRFKGKMDELRITKGVARYTSTFTPPTAAFPNS